MASLVASAHYTHNLDLNGHNVGMDVPETIICVDCGGVCHRISYADPEIGFQPGDVVAYRCSDCLDRWDLVFDES